MSAHSRMASAVTTLFDRMDEDTTEAWDSLTGLQALLVRIIATDERTDRASLAMVARTSRAATVPALHSLIRRGMVVEVTDGAGECLSLGEAGRAMLDEVLMARSEWLRRAADDAVPPVHGRDITQSAALMEHLCQDPQPVHAPE
jgi:DNA-binding MarR family transcriptional regulator